MKTLFVRLSVIILTVFLTFATGGVVANSDNDEMKEHNLEVIVTIERIVHSPGTNTSIYVLDDGRILPKFVIARLNVEEKLSEGDVIQLLPTLKLRPDIKEQRLKKVQEIRQRLIARSYSHQE